MKKKGDVSKKNRVGTYTKECPVLKGIINNIAAKRRIVPSKIEEMVETYHNWAYQALSCEIAPTVAVPNFGRFYVSSFKVRKRIYYVMRSKKEGKITYENAKAKIMRFFPIWKRSWWERMRRGKGVVKHNGKVRKSLGNILRTKLRGKWNV